MVFRGSPPAGGQEAVMFTVYAVYNKLADKVYVGQTNNLQRRLAEHNSNSLHYTGRIQGEWVLIYKESVATRSEALTREKQLKSYRGRESLREYIPG
jgi:putative endonuclease